MAERLTVRPVKHADAPHWLEMRRALFGEHESLAREVAEYFASPPATTIVLVAELPSGELAGFAEAGERGYAEGCETQPVAYLEGWYVEPPHRRRGVGRALVEAVERWASERGYSEIASDALIDNEVSVRAHTALGYTEVERIVCFRRRLI